MMVIVDFRSPLTRVFKVSMPSYQGFLKFSSHLLLPQILCTFCLSSYLGFFPFVKVFRSSIHQNAKCLLRYLEDDRKQLLVGREGYRGRGRGSKTRKGHIRDSTSGMDINHSCHLNVSLVYLNLFDPSCIIDHPLQLSSPPSQSMGSRWANVLMLHPSRRDRIRVHLHHQNRPTKISHRSNLSTSVNACHVNEQ
ncbi:hypothetical protein EV361DRAFT_498978 [Lentinula raphanica]|nr:hypothetical protein EV361DRAFT_498978 [Lentinula raphanica]